MKFSNYLLYLEQRGISTFNELEILKPNLLMLHVIWHHYDYYQRLFLSLFATTLHNRGRFTFSPVDNSFKSKSKATISIIVGFELQLISNFESI